MWLQRGAGRRFARVRYHYRSRESDSTVFVSFSFFTSVKEGNGGMQPSTVVQRRGTDVFISSSKWRPRTQWGETQLEWKRANSELALDTSHGWDDRCFSSQWLYDKYGWHFQLPMIYAYVHHSILKSDAADELPFAQTLPVWISLNMSGRTVSMDVSHTLLLPSSLYVKTIVRAPTITYTFSVVCLQFPTVAAALKSCCLQLLESKGVKYVPLRRQHGASFSSF